jgi:hypothetical protein
MILASSALADFSIVREGNVVRAVSYSAPRSWATEMDTVSSERQVARLIGFVLGGSFVLIMAIYSMVL